METNNKPRHLDTVYIIIRDVLKNWLPILCIALSAMMISYIVVDFTYKPVYTSRCTMVISAKANSTGIYADTTETEKLTDTITAVMESTVLKKRIAEELGLPAFSGGIYTKVVTGTNLMEVRAHSYNPAISFNVLNTLIDMYPEFTQDILGDIVIDVFEEPNFPSSPSNSLQYKNITGLAFLIGAAAVILIIAVHSFLLETVKNEWDASDKLDSKLLGVVYHESPYRNLKARILRQRKRLLAGAASVSFGFSETIKKIRTNVGYFQEKNGGKAVLVTSYDKDEGKTVIAANLAYTLTLKKQRVLVISGVEDVSSLLALLNVELPADFKEKEKLSIEDRVFTKEDGLLSILADTNTNSDFAGYTDMVASSDFTQFISRAKEEYDCIIVDGPCVNKNAATEVFAQLCDFSVLVVKQNYTKVPFINDTIDMLNRYNLGLAGYVFNDVYSSATVINVGYGYGYGGYSYGSYGKYAGYGKYGKYGRYGKYGGYGGYGAYTASKHSEESHPRRKKHEAKRYKNEH
ncbi:MAG: hypothetical protein IJ298_00755 [Ruminococcus sp.]|nr:hypothetical protein [Ruminococcus sp.]